MSDEMKEELLSCPFCGEEAVHDTGISPLESVDWAWCNNPECPLHGELLFTAEQWNTRPDSKPEKDCKSFCKLFAEAQLKEEFWKEHCAICKEEAVISGKPYKWENAEEAHSVVLCSTCRGEFCYEKEAFTAGFNAARR